MAADILANYLEATVTTSLNGTDAPGTSDAVTVSAVSSAWPSLSSGVTQLRVMDKADLGVSSGYEIMILTADNAGAAGSWTLTRGAEGSTVHTHTASWTLVPATTAAALGGLSQLQLISRQVLSVAAATVTFSSIPQTYENLFVSATLIGSETGTVGAVNLQFNGDTGINYSYQQLQGTTTAASAVSGSGQTSIGLGGYSKGGGTAPGLITFRVPGYARTAFQKVLLQQGSVPGPSGPYLWVLGGQWASTAAITSLSLTDSAGNFIVGSVISLYGES